MYRKIFLTIVISAFLLAGCGNEPVEPVAEVSVTETGETEVPARETETPVPTQETDTPVPEPTNEPTQEPTQEPEPTAVPTQAAVIEIDPDSAPVPAGFSFYETLEGGYSFSYPADWIAEDFFGLTFMATDEQILENSERLESGAFMMVISVPEEELEGSSLTENLSFAADGVHPDPAAGDPVILEGPAELEINGYTAGQILVEYPHSETGPVTTIITLIQNGNRYVSLIGSTPSAEAENHLPLFDAVAQSIVLMEPVEMTTFEEELPEGGSAEYDDTVLLPITIDAPAIEAELPPNGQTVFWFEATAGMVLDIDVRSSDGTDLVLELTDALGESMIGIVDDGFESEVIQAFEIPADGLYNVVVSEFSRLSGTISVEVKETTYTFTPAGSIALGETIDSLLADGETANWEFEAAIGDLVLIVADPEADFDIAFDVMDSGGRSISDGEVDEEFSGNIESVTLTIPADGTYSIQISGFASDGGRYSLSLEPQ